MPSPRGSQPHHCPDKQGTLPCNCSTHVLAMGDSSWTGQHNQQPQVLSPSSDNGKPEQAWEEECKQPGLPPFFQEIVGSPFACLVPFPMYLALPIFSLPGSPPCDHLHTKHVTAIDIAS